MNRFFRMVALGCAAALLLPGLAICLPACGMAECGVMAAGRHACCPTPDAALAAPCCGRQLDPVVAAARPPASPDAANAALLALPAALAPLAPGPLRIQAGQSPPQRSFEPLDQGCSLRI